jgi:uracil-DNA glycosylase
MNPNAPENLANMEVGEISALLRWYVDMGVDLALDDAPHDRFAESAAPLATKAQASAPASGRMAPPPRKVEDAPAQAPDALALLAKEQAQGAANLVDLRNIIEQFEGCALKATARQMVFGEGHPQASLMLIGEAPGIEEDRHGHPFMGTSGAMLEKMLGAIGLKRAEVYLAHIVPWHPNARRAVTPEELDICLPFIHRQIELVSPKILVLLGDVASRALLHAREPIMSLRGRWAQFGSGSQLTPALPMLHPDYLMRQPLMKRAAWKDLLLLKKALDGL